MWTAIGAWVSGLFKMNLTWIGILLLVLAIFGMGFYLRNLAAERDTAKTAATLLQSQLDAQTAKNSALAAQLTQQRIDDDAKAQINAQITRAEAVPSCPVALVVRDAIAKLR